MPSARFIVLSRYDHNSNFKVFMTLMFAIRGKIRHFYENTVIRKYYRNVYFIIFRPLLRNNKGKYVKWPRVYFDVLHEECNYY